MSDEQNEGGTATATEDDERPCMAADIDEDALHLRAAEVADYIERKAYAALDEQERAEAAGVEHEHVPVTAEDIGGRVPPEVFVNGLVPFLGSPPPQIGMHFRILPAMHSRFMRLAEQAREDSETGKRLSAMQNKVRETAGMMARVLIEEDELTAAEGNALGDLLAVLDMTRNGSSGIADAFAELLAGVMARSQRRNLVDLGEEPYVILRLCDISARPDAAEIGEQGQPVGLTMHVGNDLGAHPLDVLDVVDIARAALAQLAETYDGDEERFAAEPGTFGEAVRRAANSARAGDVRLASEQSVREEQSADRLIVARLRQRAERLRAAGRAESADRIERTAGEIESEIEVDPASLLVDVLGAETVSSDADAAPEQDRTDEGTTRVDEPGTVEPTLPGVSPNGIGVPASAGPEVPPAGERAEQGHQTHTEPASGHAGSGESFAPAAPSLPTPAPQTFDAPAPTGSDSAAAGGSTGD